MKRILVAAGIYTAAAVTLGYLLGRRMATIEEKLDGHEQALARIRTADEEAARQMSRLLSAGEFGQEAES